MPYNKISYKKINLIFCLSFLLILGITFFFRCYERVRLRDELVYEYVWEENDKTYLWDQGHQFNHKVSSLEDIIQTQTIHYQQVNGRSIVHGIEQFFSGITGYTTWSICNSIVFLALIVLIGFYSAGKLRTPNLLLWATVTLALLYLFPLPHSLWTSNNFAINYLWPSALAVGLLIIWKLLDSNTSLSIGRAFLIALYSIAFGWSHEGFSVGFSVGIILYYCYNPKKFKKRDLCMALPLWMGTAIMCIAPGNLIRFLGKDSSGGGIHGLSMKLLNGFDNLVSLKIFWALFLVILILLVLNRRMLKDWLFSEMRLVFVLVASLCFSMIANTAPYSFSFIELLSLLMLIRLASFNKIFTSSDNNISFVIGLVISVIICIHQILIVRDQFSLITYQREIIQNYISSDDGIIEYDSPKFSQFTEPYLPRLKYNNYTALHLVYGSDKPYEFLLNKKDYQAVRNPDKFWKENGNVFPGNAKARHTSGSDMIWLDPNGFSSNDSITLVYAPGKTVPGSVVSMRILMALFPSRHPSKERFKIQTIETAHDTAYYIKQPKLRVLRSIEK